MTVNDILLFINPAQYLANFLLYSGPDQILPLVSILGTIISFLLIMWRRLVMLMRKAARVISRRPEPAPAPEPTAKLDPAVSLEPSAKE
jgi:hypothetical protein